jgi:hypothetical protein
VELIGFNNGSFFFDGNPTIKKFDRNVLQGNKIRLKSISGGMI